VIRKLVASRIRRSLGEERGLALVAALGVTTVLALAGTSVVAFSSTNYGAASRSKADQVAYALAEAGINNAAAVVNGSATPTDPTLLPATTSRYDGGTVTWSGTLDGVNNVWTVTAVGEARNPTGIAAAPVRRTLTAQVPAAAAAAPAASQPLSNQMWNYVVAARTGNACDETLASGVTWSARLYVMGNLCFSSGATVVAGPVDVKGTATLGSTNNFVGSSTTPVSDVHVGLGCKYASNAVHTPCSSADHVYAAISDSATPALTLPAPDWDGWYKAAAPGPKTACSSQSGTVPVFDNDTLRNDSVASAVDLTAAASYSCIVGAPGAPVGQLSWDAASHVLTVKGTVFIDGNVRAGNGLLDTYNGQGVLYVSGSFEVTSNTKLCAAAVAGDCDFAGWAPQTNLLAVIANGNGGGNVFTGYSVSVGSSSRFQGALFGTYGVSFGSLSKNQGPIIASFINPCSSMQMPAFPLLATVPAGLPGQPLPVARPGAPYGYKG
jgi:Tfp pilus assembly protein PilX